MKLDHADIACLTAAKAYGLREHRIGERHPLPSSEQPAHGWWARASWSERAADASKGGPWTIERVHRLRELGLLGTPPDTPDRADLTAMGKRALKHPPTSTEDGSQTPLASDGEAQRSGATEPND